MMVIAWHADKSSIGSTTVSCTNTSGRTQPASAKLPVCVCIVRGFEEDDSLENVHSVLFCII